MLEGLGGGPRPAPTVAPAPRPTHPDRGGQVVRKALRERDHRLGIASPAGGAVASIVAGAVRTSTIPLEAKGAFEVRLNADGSFAGIRVLGGTPGEAGAWRAAARAAADQLKGKKLTLGREARGGPVAVRVQVESRSRLPSGSTAEAPITPLESGCMADKAREAIERKALVEADPTAGPLQRRWMTPERDPRTAREFDADRIGKHDEALPQHTRPSLPICIPTLGGLGLDLGMPGIPIGLAVGGKFDLSDIGAHEVRTVRSRFEVVPIDG